MKKFIFGCFAVIVLSASAISATNNSNNIKVGYYSSASDTTPHKMHDKKKMKDTMNHMNGMDTSMNDSRDSM